MKKVADNETSGSDSPFLKLGERLTPTQRRFMNLLQDGLPHSMEELRACLNDDRAEVDTVTQHIIMLRNKLKPIYILTNGRGMYRKKYFQLSRKLDDGE